MAKLIKFPSGLSVCYEKMKAGSCAFGMFVNAGSRNEGEDDNGVAHFIEHMLFKGTEKRTAYDIANETDNLGVNSNAYTSKSNTVFYFSGLAKFLPEYMDLMSDMLFNSTFSDECIFREKGVVLEEIRMYDDEGDSLCTDLLCLKYFGKDKLARPILGTEKTVRALNEKKIREFMKKYYVPQNICLSYAGPAKEEELKALVEKYFESEFVKRGGEFTEIKYKKTKTRAGFVHNFDKPFEQANVIIRFPGYTIKEKPADAASVLGIIMGSGMSSRLFNKVREELGLVYEIYANSVSIKGAGYMDIGFATEPNLVVSAIKAIREVIEEIRKDGLTKEEFEKAKILRETNSVLLAETTFDVMRLMGRCYCLTGKPQTFKSLLKEMEKIKLEDVVNAFHKIFDYDKAMVCYVGKKIDTDLADLLKIGG